jgi:hypothetical protein
VAVDRTRTLESKESRGILRLFEKDYSPCRASLDRNATKQFYFSCCIAKEKVMQFQPSVLAALECFYSDLFLYVRLARARGYASFGEGNDEQ